jgi:hypothetical protein
MRAKFSAAFALLVLSAPSAAIALTPLSTSAPSSSTPTQLSPNAAYIAWVQRVMSVTERANQATAPIGPAGDAADVSDPAAQLTALHHMRDVCSAARAQLAALSAELDAIPDFDPAGLDPRTVAQGHGLRDDTRALFGKLDALMGDTVALVDAVDAHDYATVQRLGPRLRDGITLLIQGQATIYRARQQLLPSSNPAYYWIAAIAFMYDGMAGLVVQDQDFRPSDLVAAADRIDQAINAEQSDMASYRATPPTGSTPQQSQAYLAICERTIVTAQGVAAELRAAAQEGQAGTSTSQMRMNHLAALARYETQYQAIAHQMADLAAQIAQ